MSEKIAPDVLDALNLARGAWGLSNEAQERAIAQACALRAVARAADRFLRSSTDDEDALRYADLFSAMQRLTRVSGPPSTVEGNRKPASNSSRPGRGRRG